MRAYNGERMWVEFVRIHRVVDGEASLFQLPPFIDDLAGHLASASEAEAIAVWQNRPWAVGNVNEVSAPDGRQMLSARFGWALEHEDNDTPPVYRGGQWDDSVPSSVHGALALFVVDPVTQRAAITSAVGDVRTAAFCRALTLLLNDQEYRLRIADPERQPYVEWIVDPVSAPRVFRNWYERLDRMTRIGVSFHLPNPRVDPEIEKIVGFLHSSNGTSGHIGVSNNRGQGIDPFSSDELAAAVAMQEHDYGSIVAQGIRDGQPDHFRSANHAARTSVRLDGDGRRPSFREAVAVLLEAFTDWFLRNES